MDKKFENKIIQALRKLSFSYPPRNEAKKKCKVGPALYKCQHCDCLVYEGKSKKNHEKLEEEWNQEIKMEPFCMDHIVPVVKPSEGKKLCKTFGEYIALFVDGLFCQEDNFQGICQSCHRIKTSKENELRRSKSK